MHKNPPYNLYEGIEFNMHLVTKIFNQISKNKKEKVMLVLELYIHILAFF